MADLTLRYDYTLKITSHELRLILAGLHDLQNANLKPDAAALQLRLVEQRAVLLGEAAQHAEDYAKNCRDSDGEEEGKA